MYINKFKNILIGLLIVIAVYQTSQLWFEDISNYNFFYSFLTKTVDLSSTEIKSPISMPYRIITNYGDTNYSIMLNNKLESSAYLALKGVFKDLEFIKTSNIQWEDVLKGRAYIFEYKLPVITDVFLKDIGHKSNILISKVDKFDTVAIITSRIITEPLRVLFLDKELNKCYEFSANKTNLNEKINSEIQQSQANGDILIYKASETLKSPLFLTNMFLPVWSTKTYNYQTVQAINPYLSKEGEAKLRIIEEKINVFFDNPDSKREEPSIDDIFTFSSDNIVVKYLPNNTLEYYNYYDISKVRIKTFLEDYNTAVKFISKDHEAIKKALIEDNYLSDTNNEFYLSDYTQEENKRIFYFDVAVNEFPIFISQELKKEIGMDHHIKIEIENGQVRKYTKLVYKYQIENDADNELASVGYLEAINKFIDTNDDGSNKIIQNIELGYKLDSKNKILEDNKLTLNWMLKISDIINITSAQSMD